MKHIISERTARGASHILRVCCLLVIAFCALAIVMSAMGRLTFTLHGSGGTVRSAIWANMPYEPDAEFGGGSMRLTMTDEIHAWANDGGLLSMGQKIGLMLIAAAHIVPLMAAYAALAGVFGRVGNGEIFTDRNARGLMVYGVIRLVTAAIVPFVKLGICGVVTAMGAGELTISTGQNMLGELFPSIGFIVAAYIIHYGVHLQDEVDHTL